MPNIKKAYALNLCLACMEVFSIAWMMSGLSGGVLTASRLAVLRYFTVDSNILMGAAAVISAMAQRRAIRTGKSVPTACLALKMTATGSVTLTMLVTAFYLGPTMAPAYGYFSLFANSNLFLHLLNPAAALVVFLLFEKTRRLRARHVCLGMVPVALYAVFYVAQALTHMRDGAVEPGHDWYGFFFLGGWSAVIVVPLMLALSWLICLVLQRLNRRGAEVSG